MQMYEVEAIVGKRMNPQTKIIEYQVKWFGYPSDQNTWQPEKNLVFVKNLIRQFNQKAEINGDNFLAHKNQNAPQEKVQKKSLQEIVENLNESDNEDLQANIYFQEESENQNDKQKNDPRKKKLNQEKSNYMKQSLINKKPPEPPKLSKVIEKKQMETNQLSKRSLHKPIPKQIQQKSITKQILDREQSQLYNNFNRRRQGPPPLPPDFALNKTKYIDPIISRKPSYAQPFKHKIIEKERFREEKKKIQYVNPSSQKIQEMKNRQQRNQLQNKNYYKPSSKPIPPPPPPPVLTPRHQPIVQQNYFSNQYQVYNPSISAPIVQRPHQLNNSYSIPTAQYSYTRQHAYQYNYTDQNLDQNLDIKPNKHLKQEKFNEENLQVFKVLNMEKRREGFYYYAETNLGEMWLDRSQVVPMFSTALVLFYEQYLTFQG